MRVHVRGDDVTMAIREGDVTGAVSEVAAHPAVRHEMVARQREIMRVLSDRLLFARKYVVGINPDRFSIDLELKELNPILNFADSLGEPLE